MKGQPKNKSKLSLSDKVVKYAIARHKKGVTKKEAQIIAGYKTTTHSTSIENSQTYKEIEKRFKDEFLTKSSLSEIAEALLDNIRQDGAEHIDRAARNGAIKIALDKIEPENTPTDTEERVLVVIRNA